MKNIKLLLLTLSLGLFAQHSTFAMELDPTAEKNQGAPSFKVHLDPTLPQDFQDAFTRLTELVTNKIQMEPEKRHLILNSDIMSTAAHAFTVRPTTKLPYEVERFISVCLAPATFTNIEMYKSTLENFDSTLTATKDYDQKFKSDPDAPFDQAKARAMINEVMLTELTLLLIRPNSEEATALDAAFEKKHPEVKLRENNRFRHCWRATLPAASSRNQENLKR